MPQFSDDLFLGPAQTYIGTGIRPYTTTATGGTGSVSSSTLTITALNQAINIANTTALTLHGNIAFDNPSPMDLGIGPLGRIYVWDVIPQALVTNNIAATQTPAGRRHLRPAGRGNAARVAGHVRNSRLHAGPGTGE